jgi:hypothetical protein
MEMRSIEGSQKIREDLQIIFEIKSTIRRGGSNGPCTLRIWDTLGHGVMFLTAWDCGVCQCHIEALIHCIYGVCAKNHAFLRSLKKL